MSDPHSVAEDHVCLALEDVTFTYKESSTPIIRHANLTIRQGEFVAIMGGPTSGKSTLLQLLSSILIPRDGCGIIFVPPHLRVLHLKYHDALWDRPLTDTLYFGRMA